MSIDSFHHQASAAEIQFRDSRASALTDKHELSAIGQMTDQQDTYLTFDAETAARLRHSALTSANLTRGRLTTAHFLSRTLAK
ncbi:MAG: hypothetical protein AAGH78_15585 [Cyanobacteria bacterium P01_H01_bin.58]